MIRYPAFDPPEYSNWQPDGSTIREFRASLERNRKRREVVDALTPEQLLQLYEGLVRNRLHDYTLKRWVKQGIISKAWLGTGEEATTIGPVHGLEKTTDFVAPMIRNAGACHEMGMNLADMLRGYLGTEDSPTKGRDVHIGDLTRGVIAPISQVGDMVPITAGVALSFKLKKEKRIALTWAGDGSTKTGMFHEGLNFAAVQRLPLIVIVQCNQVALGTPTNLYHRGSFLELPEAYGVEGCEFDGNNVLDAYAAVKLAADALRSSQSAGPYLMIASTFRIGGHATHDEREARQVISPALFEAWGKRDPVGLYEAYLIEGRIDLENGSPGKPGSFRDTNLRVLQGIEAKVTAEVEQAADDALASAKSRVPQGASAAERVYQTEIRPLSAYAEAWQRNEK